MTKPNWAKYKAKDQQGRTVYFEKKPRRSTLLGWITSGRMLVIDFDWRKSLEKIDEQ